MPLPVGFRHSAESKAKMSASRKGKPHAPAHKEALRKALVGKKHPLVERFCRHCKCKFLGTYQRLYCSTSCRKKSRINSPEFAEFPKVCAICGLAEKLVGDHNHLNGKARGVLCSNCNLAIGNMKDDPELLRRAAIYLEEAC